MVHGGGHITCGDRCSRWSSATKLKRRGRRVYIEETQKHLRYREIESEIRTGFYGVGYRDILL